MGESIWCFRNSTSTSSVSKPSKKLTSIPKGTHQYTESFKLKRRNWPWKIQRPAISCFLQNQNVHLSLSAVCTTTTHQHLYDSIFSLSTPNLDSRCLTSLPEIEIHCWSSPVSMRLTFLFRRKKPKTVSFTLFPTTGVRSFLAASNTWHCKKVFFSLFEFIFWIFLFTYMVCFVFINWHVHSYVERKLVLFDKMFQWGWMH